MSAATKVKLLPFELEIFSGPHLGQKFSFADTAVITIGRGVENQISLPHDPRVSRIHVEIKQENEVFYIYNKSPKNAIAINGHKEEQYKLTQTCMITVGESEIKFYLPQPVKQFRNPLQPLSPTAMPMSQMSVASHSQSQGPILKAPVPSPYSTQAPPPSNNQSAPRKRKSIPKKQESFNAVFLIIIVAVILVAIFVMPTKPEESQKPDRMPDIVTPVFQEEQRLKESMDKVKASLEKMENQNSRQAMAQQFFISGMREFLNGNYQRALSFLNSAYQSDPTLVDAEKFAREAQRKLDRLIDFYYAEGLKYRESNNFRMCKSSFQTVQQFIRSNLKHPHYIEAKQYYEECSNLDKARRF